MTEKKRKVLELGALLDGDDSLKEMAEKELGETGTFLDQEPTIVKDRAAVPASVCGVLVKLDSGSGAVWVVHQDGDKTIISPAPGKGSSYVLILVYEGDECAVMGSFSLRYLHRK